MSDAEIMERLGHAVARLERSAREQAKRASQLRRAHWMSTASIGMVTVANVAAALVHLLP